MGVHNALYLCLSIFDYQERPHRERERAPCQPPNLSEKPKFKNVGAGRPDHGKLLDYWGMLKNTLEI